MADKEYDITEAMLLELARAKGWTPAETLSVLLHCRAPLEGFKVSIMAAETCLRIADEELQLERRARLSNPANPRSAHAPSFDSFDPEDKEGELRRKWSNEHRKNFRMLLTASRQHFERASQFQGEIGRNLLDAQPVKVEEEEQDEEALAEARRAEEVSRRLHELARREYETTGKREKNGVKKRAKQGLEAIARREAEAEIGE